MKIDDFTAISIYYYALIIMQIKINLALFFQIIPNLTTKNINIVHLIITNILSLSKCFNCIFYKLYANTVRLFKRYIHFI